MLQNLENFLKFLTFELVIWTVSQTIKCEIQIRHYKVNIQEYNSLFIKLNKFIEDLIGQPEKFDILF